MAGVDLVEFLTARLDKDEALAVAVQTGLGDVRAGEPYEDGSGIADRDEYPSYPWGHSSPAELPFMARWHPRTVLAEVAAKRRMVELHSIPCDECLSGEYVTIDQVDVPKHYGMEPCRTLRLLALPYAEHPDYSADWAPHPM